MGVVITQGTQTTIKTTTTGDGEVQHVQAESGTIALLTRAGNIGTIESGTVTVGALPQVSVGTLPTINVTTGTITTGSLANIAKVHDAGTIAALPQVSIGTLPTLNLTTGTITTGSLANIAKVHNAGTIAALPQVSVGTIPQISVGTLPQVSVGTLPTLNLTTGTITTGSLANVAQIHNAGTIQAGTVQINSKPVSLATSYNVVGTTGAAVWGTLVAASGAGTYQYVSGIDIVVVSGTVEVAVTNIGVDGSAGAGVLARGNFAPGGGISKPFIPVVRSGTNGTLSYWLGGAGTVDITIQYWQGV